MVIVFAAGNAGPGSQTVGSPGTAKNIITVGAAENVQSHATSNGGNDVLGNDGCSTPDSGATTPMTSLISRAVGRAAMVVKSRM